MNQLSVASVCTLSAELHSSLQETIISRKLQTYALLSCVCRVTVATGLAHYDERLQL